MNLTIVQSEGQYQEYLDRINEFMDTDPSPATYEGQLLDQLTTLVEDYERKMGWELSEKN